MKQRDFLTITATAAAGVFLFPQVTATMRFHILLEWTKKNQLSNNFGYKLKN